VLSLVILATQETEIGRVMVLKSARAQSSWDLISKKSFMKKGWWSGSRCRSWFQTPVPQKLKRMKKYEWNRQELCQITYND
jgi:hypothetical protein